MPKHVYTTGRELRAEKRRLLALEEARRPVVKIHVLPGGRLPERQTKGAVGYDVCLRAIVSATEMDADNPSLRKTLFDFRNLPADPQVAEHVLKLASENGGDGELVYQLFSGESVLVGIGFMTEMPFPVFYWTSPRSGLAAKYGVTVTNAPGTVDPDYRGEAGVLIYNRTNRPFLLRHQMRIAQILFGEALIPKFETVPSAAELSVSIRGTGGFGSTGL